MQEIGPAGERGSTVDDFRREGETLLKQGAPLVAYDVLAEGLKRFPADARLRQLTALALARTGASRLASRMLEELVAEGHANEETLGLLGRTYKDLSADSVDAAERVHHLQRALQAYRAAHHRSVGYWTGINAATMAALLGDQGQMAELAQAVRQTCLRILRGDPGEDERYWVLATLGEAALLLREWSEAEEWYGLAEAVGGRRLGDLVSTRRNARLIVQHYGVEGGRIEACFKIPRVVVFSGHLIDRPDRPSPRFPPALELDVRRALDTRLRQLDVGFGYASAGCGSDILFLESLDELRAAAHIVLPYNRDQFRRDSVDIIPEGDWGVRYDRLLESAAEVTTASDQPMLRSSMSYEYGSLLLDGTAAVRSDELDTELVCLAVWDGRLGDGPGGTAEAVARWRTAGRRVEIIDTAELLRRHSPVSVTAPSRSRGARADTNSAAPEAGRQPEVFDAQIVGLMFADVQGFSKLTEEQIPLFVQHFLGTVAGELARAPCAPVLTNTWGDGLYFVFRSVRETGEFALRLCEAVGGIDWTERGLPGTLALRIGLHAGPAYACLDPVTGRTNYLGVHVSRAARIEPITPAGEVYASRAFAALARAEQVREFACAYVGQVPLAKQYGTFPTYVVHQRRAFDPVELRRAGATA